MLIKFSKKGCCRNLFDRLKYHSWKQLELSLVKGSQDVVDLDKSWNWAWQFTLPSKMIVEPKKIEYVYKFEGLPKNFLRIKIFTTVHKKKLIFVENWKAMCIFCLKVKGKLPWSQFKFVKEVQMIERVFTNSVCICYYREFPFLKI